MDPIYFCWRWCDRKDKQGYGILFRPKIVRAHKYVWQKEVGQVPKGLVLDHWCRRRDCCNPMHLEPVTQSKNEIRKLWRVRARLKECRFGHDLFLNGRLTPEGGRVCKICR